MRWHNLLKERCRIVFLKINSQLSWKSCLELRFLRKKIEFDQKDFSNNTQIMNNSRKRALQVEVVRLSLIIVFVEVEYCPTRMWKSKKLKNYLARKLFKVLRILYVISNLNVCKFIMKSGESFRFNAVRILCGRTSSFYFTLSTFDLTCHR